MRRRPRSSEASPQKDEECAVHVAHVVCLDMRICFILTRTRQRPSLRFALQLAPGVHKYHFVPSRHALHWRYDQCCCEECPQRALLAWPNRIRLDQGLSICTDKSSLALLDTRHGGKALQSLKRPGFDAGPLPHIQASPGCLKCKHAAKISEIVMRATDTRKPKDLALRLPRAMSLKDLSLGAAGFARTGEGKDGQSLKTG